ncbi:MAG: hypothetical protein Q8R98_07715, partial [Rubrivivax sp.]|nr:hypothetical protein [Rubrivivax sp.]
TLKAGAVVDGRLSSGGTAGGGLTFTAGRDVLLQGLVLLNDGHFQATAGRLVQQSAGSAVATGSGNITVSGAAGVQASNLLSTGAVQLGSTSGAVTVANAISGAGGAAARLDVTAATAVTLAGDVLSRGTIAISAGSGSITTTAATLDAGGDITLNGAGLSLGALRSAGAVRLTSTASDQDTLLAGAVAGMRLESSSARHLNLGADIDLRAGSGGFVAAAAGNFTQAADTTVSTGAGPISISAATGIDARSLLSTGAVVLNSLGSGGQVTVRNGLGRSDSERTGSLAIDATTTVTLGGGALVAGTSTLTARGGTLDTGSTPLDSQGAIILAGVGVTLGPVKGGSSLNVTSTGAADIQVDGNVEAGNLSLSSARDVRFNADADLRTLAGAFTVSAPGRFTQSATSTVATGSGAIDITADAGIDVSTMLSLSDVSLKAAGAGGTVRVRQALGNSTSRLGSLQLDGDGSVLLDRGALVTGSTTLVSRTGQVNTSGATLDSRGDVAISAATGLDAAAIVSLGAVSLTGTGTSTPITLSGAVAGEAVDSSSAQISASTAKATGLNVITAGAVSLNGAALGSGGLSVNGTGSGAAGAINLSNAVYSSGAVSLNSAATVQVAAAGGVEIATAANLTINAVGDITALGPLKAAGGTISIDSSGGRVELHQVATNTPTSASGTLWIDAASDVVLAQPLGGSNTGYALFADKYQPSLKPNVGRVVATAGRDIETNGLNLDGREDATPNPDSQSYVFYRGGTTYAGLALVAGNRIVSNGLIAVNKGDVVFNVSQVGGTNGIYLGQSVYAR